MEGAEPVLKLSDQSRALSICTDDLAGPLTDVSILHTVTATFCANFA